MDVEMDQVDPTTAAQKELTPAPDATPPAPPNPDLEAYNQRWQIVQADPQDFTTWTSLLTVAERLDDIEKIRTAFDGFLSEYPLCYGYWKKYADAEARHQNTELALHVYERGVAATPYSSDLWAHYAAFKKGLPDSTPEDVRGIYERGLAYLAADYNSQGLWDKYFAYETERASTLHIASLYARVLGCPVKELDRYYTSFKNYIHPLAGAQIVVPHEYDAIRVRLETERAAEQAKIAAAAEAKAAAEVKVAAEAKAKAATEAAEAKLKSEAEAEAASGMDTDQVKVEPVEGEKAEEADGAVAVTAPETDVSTAADETEVKVEPAENGDAETAPGTEETPAANGDTDHPMAESAAVKAAAEDTPTELATATADVTPAVASEGAVKAEPEPAAPAAPQPPKPEPIVITDEEIKQVWVRQQEETYERTKLELLRRKPFEDAARRPYFHIKPLDGVQLFNWIRYLDYVEAKGDHGATVTLYERCLVACANYPEFWQRYVRYLERTDLTAARSGLERAVQGFCKRRPEMHLFAAQFAERHRDVEGARARFKQLLGSVAPRLLEAVTAAANFERRQGNLETACSYLSELMQEEKAKEGSRIYPFLAIHYAHFLRRHSGDVVNARKVLDEALSHCPGVRSLWEAAIHFEELVGGPEAVARALDLYDKCTSTPAEGAVAAAAAGRCLPERDREELSARSVDFADMYGTADQVHVVSARHANRFMLPTTVTAEARSAATAKRVADASGAAPAAKAPRPDVAAAAAAAATAPAANMPVPQPPPMMPPAAAAAAAGYYPPAPPAAAAAAYPYYGYGQYPPAAQYPGYGAYPTYGY